MSNSVGDRKWRIPLVGPAPGDAPADWVAAFAAVTRDLQCRQYGGAVPLVGAVWTFTVTAEDWVHIGMTRLTDDSDLGGFSVGKGYTLATTQSQATVWIAEVIQDELSGYEFVQWPSDGWRMLVPELQNDRAVWVDPSTEKVVAPIGELCDLPIS
jgi:hypothetical protein